MSIELLINASLPETRIALMENGEIQELLIERPSEKGIVGNIYKGRVSRVLPGMQAAFVDIGLEKAAFLYVDDVFVHSEIWEEEEGPSEPGFTPEIEREPETEVSAGDNVQADSDVGMPEDGGEDSGSVSMGPDPKEGEAGEGQSSEGQGTLSENQETEQKPQSTEAEKLAQIRVEAGQESGNFTNNNRRPKPRGRRGGRSHRRPEGSGTGGQRRERGFSRNNQNSNPVSGPNRADGRGAPPFKSRDRRVRPKMNKPVRGQVNIQDLLQEGQEVLVQVAKAPIATKGARLTCHISLPGRHLVCMPTIDHVGVSRKIERDDERRRLREQVDRNRPKGIGFIVRTASAKSQSEKILKQDIDYLTRIWGEIREKAATVTAPALVYEDLNSVLRSIRDWVTEDIDKIIVDSRYHYNDILRFVSDFMPSLKTKVDLYHGDIPVFDAYNISTELSRALERKVWLKSGGYIVIDQSEALVAIDVNTGRFVGKKNLEDTILKTNLEAVKEIAYQLRLRNCGGIIILDLIDMENDENRYRVYRALEEALLQDRARPSILKISELGLIEMTRKRTRDTIIRTLCESCSHCEGKGFIKSKQTVAYEVLREIERVGLERDSNKILVQAHTDVIDFLAIDERETLDQLERRYRKQIYLQAVLNFHPEQFEVSSEKRNRKENSDIDGQEKTGSKTTLKNEEKTEISEEKTELPQVAAPIKNNERHQTPSPVVVPAKVPTPIHTTQVHTTQVHTAPVQVKSQRTPREDGFYDEEDRLAFLRAQATQDAALAHSNAEQNKAHGGAGGGGGLGPRRNFDSTKPGPWKGRNQNNRGGHRGRTGGFGGRPNRSRSSQHYGRPQQNYGNSGQRVVRDAAPNVASEPVSSPENVSLSNGPNGNSETDYL